MKKPKSILSLLEYIDGCWYAVYPKCGIKVRCKDQYSAYVKQLEILNAPCPKTDDRTKPAPQPEEKYHITLSYNELEDCSAEAYPMTLRKGQNSTLSITAPDDVEWNVSATNATLIGPTYDTGTSTLRVTKARGDIHINIPFEKDAGERTIKYESTQEIIGEWIENNTDTERNTYDSETCNGILYLNEEIESIDASNSPFYNNSSILSVNLNNSGMTNIGDHAFAYKPSLRDDETRIGWLTNDVNNGLTFIDNDFNIYDDGGPDGSCGQTNTTHTIYSPIGTRIKIAFSFYEMRNAWLNVYNKESIDYTDTPDKTYSTGSRIPESFISSSNFMTLNYHSSIVSARAGFCATLSTVDESGNPIHIDGDMRLYQSNINSIIMPDDIAAIDDSCFENCKNLMSIKLPDNITSIGTNAFKNCNSLISVIMPNSVINMNDGAFDNCNNLIYIKLSDNITSISKNAFKNCNSLEDIVIPENVTLIDENAFNGCISFINVVIPNSVTEIKLYAFKNCPNIETVKLSNSLITIGQQAFYECTKITSIRFPASISTISGFGLCTGLKRVDYDGTIEQWCHINFVGYTNPLYYAHDLYIDNEIVTNVSIPDDIEYINSCLFYGSSIKYVTIPSTVTQIGYLAFEQCEQIINVTCYAQEPPTLGDRAFPSHKRICYVPAEYRAAYVQSDWHNYFNIYALPTE